jgi:hypothetical protein
VWHTVAEAEVVLGDEITSAGDKEGALETRLKGHNAQSLHNGQHLCSLGRRPLLRTEGSADS